MASDLGDFQASLGNLSLCLTTYYEEYFPMPLSCCNSWLWLFVLLWRPFENSPLLSFLLAPKGCRRQHIHSVLAFLSPGKANPKPSASSHILYVHTPYHLCSSPLDSLDWRELGEPQTGHCSRCGLPHGLFSLLKLCFLNAYLFHLLVVCFLR